MKKRLSPKSQQPVRQSVIRLSHDQLLLSSIHQSRVKRNEVEHRLRSDPLGEHLAWTEEPLAARTLGNLIVGP